MFYTACMEIAFRVRHAAAAGVFSQNLHPESQISTHGRRAGDFGPPDPLCLTSLVFLLRQCRIVCALLLQPQNVYGCILLLRLVIQGGPKKVNPKCSTHNFVKYWPILKILSLL